MKSNGRDAMEMTLRWLGRPDLAKYVKEKHRLINFLNTEDYDIARTLEFPGHAVSKRHASQKDKQQSAHGTKKNKGRKKKRHHHKEVRKADGTPTGHAAGYTRSGNKEDKDTYTDYLEWEDDAICSCSDIEGGCNGKCLMCNQNDETFLATNHAGNSGGDTNYSRKMNKKKRKKRQRFSFLQKTFQDKKTERHQEGQDKKKTSEKSFLKKREKAPVVQSKDQCTCCQCTLNSKDNMIREKRKLHRWKTRRKKEEKRRNKEEPRKIDRQTNVCFNETCK